MAAKKKGSKKKIVLFTSLVIGVMALIGIGAYFMFKEDYRSCTCVMDDIDEYGYAKMSNGEEIVFRGNFVCDDGSTYYYSNMADLVGKELYVEYRVTDEGDLKVEKFGYDGVMCEKGSFGRHGGE